MDDNINELFLLNIKPHYEIIIYCIIISFIITIGCLFYFKTYDVYKTKGYINCEEYCYVRFNIDSNDISLIDNISFISIKNNNYEIKNTEIGEIEFDMDNKINYQTITYEVENVNDNIINTFQDVKLYSNYEIVIRKIIKFIK